MRRRPLPLDCPRTASCAAAPRRRRWWSLLQRAHRRLRGDHGQAAVELVAMLPVLVAAVLAVVQVLAAGAAAEAASNAAEAGAVALLQDADPAAAAKQALGPSATTRSTILVRGRRVTVRVRPLAPVRAVATALTATSAADAGPGAAAATSTTVVRGGDGQGSKP